MTGRLQVAVAALAMIAAAASAAATASPVSATARARVRPTARRCPPPRWEHRRVATRSYRPSRCSRRAWRRPRSPGRCWRTAVRRRTARSRASRCARRSSAWRAHRRATATGSRPPAAACTRSATRITTARPATCTSTRRSWASPRHRPGTATGWSRRRRHLQLRRRGLPRLHRRHALWAPVLGMAATASGNGYWLVAADGGIFSFGDAHFHGSTGGMHLWAPVLGMAATPSGNGYWLVAADGGIFSFGDAHFHGSTGGLQLWAPIVGMATTPTGHGYWLVGSDGGIFTFGDADFAGSAGGIRGGPRFVGINATPDGHGYWLLESSPPDMFTPDLVAALETGAPRRDLGSGARPDDRRNVRIPPGPTRHHGEHRQGADPRHVARAGPGAASWSRRRRAVARDPHDRAERQRRGDGVVGRRRRAPQCTPSISKPVCRPPLPTSPGDSPPRPRSTRSTCCSTSSNRTRC